MLAIDTSSAIGALRASPSFSTGNDYRGSLDDYSPLAGTVAAETGRQISPARAAAIHECRPEGIRNTGYHRDLPVSDLHGPIWPTRMIGKARQ
jgi:hypothetical protein